MSGTSEFVTIVVLVPVERTVWKLDALRTDDSAASYDQRDDWHAKSSSFGSE